MDPLPNIPTPAAQRWREFRIQVLPFAVFVGVVILLFYLWRSYVVPVGIVGQVEAVRVNVTSLTDGVIKALLVDRFEEVKKDQPLAIVETIDPDLLKAQVAAVAAEMAVLRTRITIDERQREQNFHRFRLDILDQKVSLARAKAELTGAATNYYRIKQLVDAQQESPAQLDLARSKKETLEAEISERTFLIADLSTNLPAMAESVIPKGEDPIKDAIDAKEHEMEEAVKPTVLKSPINGIVSFAFKQAGERVLRGEPLVTVTDPKSHRVVGYIRQPINVVPTTNDLVKVRTRSIKRRMADGQIVRVGGELEPINSAILSPEGNRTEYGLPVLISIPPELVVVPGEYVDIQLSKR